MNRRYFIASDVGGTFTDTILYDKDEKEIFINGILDIIENEIVISLKDKSAHSVLLQDRVQADIFADFIQSVIDNVNTITDTKVIENVVEITKG